MFNGLERTGTSASALGEDRLGIANSLNETMESLEVEKLGYLLIEIGNGLSKSFSWKSIIVFVPKF